MGKTVRVRIAVAVDHAGQWNSCGWSSKQEIEDEKVELACEGVDNNAAIYWIDADLPLPEITAIKGTVTLAKQES